MGSLSVGNMKNMKLSTSEATSMAIRGRVHLLLLGGVAKMYFHKLAFLSTVGLTALPVSPSSQY